MQSHADRVGWIVASAHRCTHHSEKSHFLLYFFKNINLCYNCRWRVLQSVYLRKVATVQGFNIRYFYIYLFLCVLCDDTFMQNVITFVILGLMFFLHLSKCQPSPLVFLFLLWLGYLLGGIVVQWLALLSKNLPGSNLTVSLGFTLPSRDVHIKLIGDFESYCKHCNRLAACLGGTPPFTHPTNTALRHHLKKLFQSISVCFELHTEVASLLQFQLFCYNTYM